MVLVNTAIRTFHADHYGPDINKLDFYHPHVTILGGNNCGKQDVKVLKNEYVHRCEYYPLLYRVSFF